MATLMIDIVSCLCYNKSRAKITLKINKYIGDGK